MAWAIRMQESFRKARNNFPIHELAGHIDNYEDTEAFMKAFKDLEFGQCRETFTEGPDYWIKIPEIRAKWQGGLSEEQTKAVMDALTDLRFNKDRDPNQVVEIKRGLKRALSAEKTP